MLLSRSFLLAVLSVVLAACATGVTRDATTVNRGATPDEVRRIMGPPEDRQFKDKHEAWQYCETGFVNDSFVVIWFYDGKVTGVRTYKDGVGDIGMCDSHFASIRWEEAPDVTVEIRGR